MLIMRASTTENEDIDGMNSFQRGLKRIGDILGSAIGLVLLSPLFVDWCLWQNKKAHSREGCAPEDWMRHSYGLSFRGLGRFPFMGVHDLFVLFRGTILHENRIPQTAKYLRVMEQFLIPPELLRGQVGEILVCKAHHEKGSCNDVIIAQHPVERQPLQLAFVIADDTGAILPGVHAFDKTAHDGLFCCQTLFDFRFPGILPGFHDQYFHVLSSYWGSSSGETSEA